MGVQDLHKLKGSHLSDRSNFAPRTNRFTCLVADGKNILLAREAKDENRQSLTTHGVLDFGSWLWGFWISQADLIQPPNSYRIQQTTAAETLSCLEVNSTWKCSFLEVVNLKFDLVGQKVFQGRFSMLRISAPKAQFLLQMRPGRALFPLGECCAAMIPR